MLIFFQRACQTGTYRVVEGKVNRRRLENRASGGGVILVEHPACMYIRARGPVACFGMEGLWWILSLHCDNTQERKN